jgi:hypothetical protein
MKLEKHKMEKEPRKLKTGARDKPSMTRETKRREKEGNGRVVKTPMKGY